MLKGAEVRFSPHAYQAVIFLGGDHSQLPVRTQKSGPCRIGPMASSPEQDGNFASSGAWLGTNEDSIPSLFSLFSSWEVTSPICMEQLTPPLALASYSDCWEEMQSQDCSLLLQPSALTLPHFLWRVGEYWVQGWGPERHSLNSRVIRIVMAEPQVQILAFPLP